MTRSLAELKAKLKPEVVSAAEAETERLLGQMALAELREARKLTQKSLAQHLGVGQAAISKLEKRTDMYLSSIKSYVEAMGGQFSMTATFPDGAVDIQLFSDLDAEAS